MEYLREVLDRGIGQLTTQSMGDWITVTELGQHYDVGPRKVRAVLHHIGVLGREGQRYRLLRRLAVQGIGHRHDFPRSGRAFDVISPKGQKLIASTWSQAVRDYEAESGAVAMVAGIRSALEAFKSGRNSQLGTAGEVRWILDHFRDARFDVVAKALEVSPALVTRYAKQRSDQIEYWKRKLHAPLDHLTVAERLSRLTTLIRDED